MQKKLYQIAVWGLGIFSGGCNLDLAPENVMVNENVYKNETTAEAALFGAYVRLNSFFAGAPNDQNNYANSGYVCLMGDVGTGNLKAQSTANSFLDVETAEYTQDDHEGFIRSMWTGGYNAIDYANNVIAGVTKYGKYNPDKMAQHIAEAKFLRGYENLLLLQLFGDQALMGNMDGLGLVIRTTPYDGYNPDNIESRTTVGETYEWIIRDLTEAIQDLPDGIVAVTERYRATKSVARALLSRVYLYRGTYNNVTADLQMAANLADMVLKNPNYVFDDSPEAYLNGLFPLNVADAAGAYPNPVLNNSEVLFYQPSGNSVENYPHVLTAYFNKRSFHIDDTSFYEENDLRGAGSLIGAGASSEYLTLKTSLKYSSSGGYNDVMYLRLSEVKLTYAEAITRISNNVDAEAVQHLNDIRLRPFTAENKPEAYTVASFGNSEELLEAILLERRRELAYEGHYRWDLIRTGKKLRNELPDNKKNFPVPQYEITISGGAIRQNTGF